jgi:hypothetical protein
MVVVESSVNVGEVGDTEVVVIAFVNVDASVILVVCVVEIIEITDDEVEKEIEVCWKVVLGWLAEIETDAAVNVKLLGIDVEVEIVFVVNVSEAVDGKAVKMIVDDPVAVDVLVEIEVDFDDEKIEVIVVVEGIVSVVLDKIVVIVEENELVIVVVVDVISFVAEFVLILKVMMLYDVEGGKVGVTDEVEIEVGSVKIVDVVEIACKVENEALVLVGLDKLKVAVVGDVANCFVVIDGVVEATSLVELDIDETNVNMVVAVNIGVLDKSEVKVEEDEFGVVVVICDVVDVVVVVVVDAVIAVEALRIFKK